MNPNFNAVGLVLLTLLAAAGVADAKPDPEPEPCGDCTYQDIVTGKIRSTRDGVSAEAARILEQNEGGWSIREDLREKYLIAHPLVEQDLSDSGDPAYDEDPDEEPWWMVILRLILEYVEYVEDFELNGEYDGYINVDGVQVPAYVKLAHFGGDVRGHVAVLEPFTIDAGACPSAEVPAGTAFAINATEVPPTAPHHVHEAEGGTTRRVGHVLFWDINATVSFSLALANDYETLVGSIDLVITDPCADSHYTGVFHRRSVL